MGNSAKKPDDYEIVSSYEHRQWSVHDQLMNCQIWKNKLLNYQVEAYEIQANLKPQELDRYTFRNQNNKDIVGVHHVIPEDNDFLCSKGDKMHVLTERIPVTLDRVNNLNENEALCVLSSAYSGYNTIGSHYGPVMPYQNCIGFTPIGKPKVWINSNFASNCPFKDQKISDSDELQKRNRSYVREIFNMVDQRTIGGLPRLREIFNKKQPTYFEALNILQHYSQTTGIKVPSTIESRHINPNNQYQLVKRGGLQKIGSSAQKKVQPLQVNQLNYQQYQQKLVFPEKNSGTFYSQMQNQNRDVKTVNLNRFPHSQIVYMNNPHNISPQRAVIRNNQYFSPPANFNITNQVRRQFVSPPTNQVPFKSRSFILNNQIKVQNRSKQEFISGAEKQSQTVFVESQARSNVLNQGVKDLNADGSENQRSNKDFKQQQQGFDRSEKQLQQTKQNLQSVNDQPKDQNINRVTKKNDQQMQSSRVEKVENKDTLQRVIQQTKSQQNLIRRVAQTHTIIHQITPQQHIQFKNVQFPNQIREQQRFVSPQPHPTVQFGAQQVGLPFQNYLPNQMMVRDQFGRIVYVNQTPHLGPQQHHIYSNPIQINYSQLNPSPQMVSKSQSIQQARRSLGQTPEHQKQQQQVYHSQEQQQLPQQSQINMLNQMETDYINTVQQNIVSAAESGTTQIRNQNLNQDEIDYSYSDLRKRVKQQAPKQNMNQDEIDYSYSDLRKRVKESTEKSHQKEIQKPHVVNQQDQDDQYQQYIRLQQERQLRIQKDRRRQQIQRQIDQRSKKQPNYQVESRQRQNGFQFEERVARTLSSNQQRQVSYQRPAQNQIIDNNFDQQIKRSNKQIRESSERRKNDAYSKQIDQAIDKERKQLKHLASFEIQRKEPSETSKNEPIQYGEESVKQYRSIDENRQRRYDQDQTLKRSYNSPNDSPRKRSRQERQRRNLDRQQSPKSHTSGKSRSSQLQMARLDRQRQRLEKERKEIEARRNKRDQYWNSQQQKYQHRDQRQNQARFGSPEEDIVNNTNRGYQRQERQNIYNRPKKDEGPDRQERYERPERQNRQQKRREDINEEMPSHVPVLNNAISVTTTYEVVNTNSPEEYSYASGYSSNLKNQIKRQKKERQPAIPESYEIEDIEEYIRKKYNIKSQPSNVQQPKSYQYTKYENRYGTKYDNKYETSKYETNKHDTSKNDTSNYDTSKYDKNKYEVEKYDSKVHKYMQQSDRSGKGDQQLGRHNLLTFMPQDREKNLLVIQKQIKKQKIYQEGFDVADMEMNLKKFEQSKHRAPKLQSSYQATRMQIRVQDNGDGQRVTRKKYQRSYKDQDDFYGKHSSNYQENIEPSSTTYQRRKDSRNTNEYTKDLDKYKGSSAIDDKYEKYIARKQKLKESQTSNRIESQVNADSDNRGSKTRSRFEKYTKQSRTFEEKYGMDEFDRLGKGKEVSNSNTFVKKEGGIDKVSYDYLRSILYS